MPTPDELRDEADSSDRLARQISYGPHRKSLTDRAAALRQQVDRQEQATHRPRGATDQP